MKKNIPEPAKKKVYTAPGGKNENVITLEDIERLKITKQDLKRLKRKKGKVKGGSRDIVFTTYESNRYGKIANSFFNNLSEYFIETYPNAYGNLKLVLIKSGIKLLSRTYVSIIFFSGFLAFFAALFFSFVINIFLGSNIILGLIKSIGIAFVIGACIFTFVYIYPQMVDKNRNRAIANDLPFVIIHMAAVSGSGAQPISIFNLVLNTGEYKGLESEIRKIVNYVNLFGYDLTTALRNVAATTPSPKFRELLNGIITTLESGGDLRDYLKTKAEDAFNTYKLEREKYVESLATYSDIYIGVLVAAPLLFIVTLAIIDLLGGKICFGSFCAEAVTLAFMGTYFVIPFLNVFFLVFLNLVQPET